MSAQGRWLPTWRDGRHWRWVPRAAEWRPLTAYPSVWYSTIHGSWVGHRRWEIRRGFNTPQTAARWALELEDA